MDIINEFTKSEFSEFITTTIGDNGEELIKVNDAYFDSVASFILTLILPSYVKRNMKNTDTYEMYDTFYECLYRYSHKRLEAALTIPAVS